MLESSILLYRYVLVHKLALYTKGKENQKRQTIPHW